MVLGVVAVIEVIFHSFDGVSGVTTYLPLFLLVGIPWVVFYKMHAVVSGV